MRPSDFERELEVFGWEADAATQCFYAWLAVHAAIGDDENVHAVLDDAAVFWNTVLYSLQASTFIALNRIFDQDSKSKHNINKLLRMAQDNAHMFTKLELGRRKKAASPNWRKWLRDYMRDAHQSTPEDFRRLRKHVRKWRRVYEVKYRPIRHNIYAHRGLFGGSESDILWGNTNIREMQLLLRFLRQLHEALWELFHNGRKPTLRPQRYAVKRMRDQPSATGRANDVHERMVRDVHAFLTKVR
jgi:hypothetical protein